MGDSAALSDNYRIEVSGWGLNDTFFVEKTDLHWTEGGDKRLLLHHSLPERAVIFVRLISVETPYAPVPVAYQVESVQPMNAIGLCEMRLLRLLPRCRTRDCHEVASLSTKGSSKLCEPKESSFQPDIEEVLHEA